jgi:hypothetical protein
MNMLLAHGTARSACSLIVWLLFGATACGAGRGELSPESTASTQNAVDGVVPILPNSVAPSPRQNHGLNYFQCAQEGEPCVLNGVKYIAFGMNAAVAALAGSPDLRLPTLPNPLPPLPAGSNGFVFRNVASGIVSCTKDSFGGVDPYPNVPKACFFANFELFATEGPVLSSFNTDVDLAFGAAGVFNFKHVLAGTAFACNNTTFGDPDPAPNQIKQCYLANIDYTFASGEGATLNLPSNTPVAYGAHGQFAYQILSGSVACGNGTFGDPIRNVPKNCYTLDFAPQSSPISFTDEGQMTPPGFRQFLYTSGRNGAVTRKSFNAAQGSVLCANDTFGGDLDFLVPKHCFSWN